MSSVSTRASAGAQCLSGRLIASSRALPSGLIVLGTIAAWGVSSLVEFNASVFVAAVAMLLIGTVITRLVDGKRGAAMPLFAVAYLLRSLFAFIAYYSGKGEAYWVGGAGSDAIAYYNTSFLDLGEALFEFTYKGFVTYNSYVTHWALAFDDAHYLCNLQGTIIAGTLLVVLVYSVVRELRDERTAYIVGLILALHPALISISAILLRDSLVGVFGWMTMLLIVRLFRVRSIPAGLLYLLLTVLSVVTLSFLRLQSMLVFLGLSLVALFFSTRPGPSHPGLPPGVRRFAIICTAVLAVGGTLVMLAGSVPTGLDAEYFKYIVEYRLGNAAQGSLGIALASGNIVTATVMYSLLALLAPFPFYAWSPESLGHPTAPLDYLVGMGGVTNQLLLACAIIGFARALQRRDTMILAWVPCIVSFVAMTTLGGGDTIRYVAVHVFPLYLMMVVDGGRVLRRHPRLVLTWLGALVSLYLVYETLKVAMTSRYTLLAILLFTSFFVTFLYRAWRVAKGARVSGGAVLVATEPGMLFT